MSSPELESLLWVAAWKSFLIALVLTPVIRDISRSYNVVDRPGRRKVHAYPIPRVGGITIAVAYALSLLTFTGFNDQSGGYGSPVGQLLPGAGLIFLVGLVDDVINLQAVVKLGWQIAAAGTVFFSGLRIETIGEWAVPGWASFALTVGWLLLTMNALNLIDGLDGLCAGLGLLATVILFLGAAMQGNAPLSYAVTPLAGALLGFLWFNLNPATVFLGDSGALLIGFLLGCFGLLWTGGSVSGGELVVPLCVVFVPVLDVSLSIVRRYLASQPIFGADQGHIHHRLLDQGFSPKKAVLVLYGAAALAGGFAILFGLENQVGWRGALVAVFGVVVWAGVNELRYAEFDMAGKLLFRGEFHRVMKEKLRLQQVTSALQRAGNEQEWWAALVEAGRNGTWTRVRWLGRPDREHRFREGTPDWVFEIRLSDDEAIQVQGGGEGAGESILDLAGLAEAVRRTFVEKVRGVADNVAGR